MTSLRGGSSMPTTPTNVRSVWGDREESDRVKEEAWGELRGELSLGLVFKPQWGLKAQGWEMFTCVSAGLAVPGPL